MWGFDFLRDTSNRLLINWKYSNSCHGQQKSCLPMGRVERGWMGSVAKEDYTD